MAAYLVDLTTSRQYRGVPPVGIVRTEREVVLALLRAVEDLNCVFYDPDRHFFRSISREEAREIVTNDSTPQYDEKGMLYIPPPSNYPRIELTEGDVLISAGLVWDNDFLEHVYEEKRAKGIRFIQIVYDIVPTVMPEFCVGGMFERFPRFIVNTLWTADAIFGISDHTNEDLERYSKKIGAPLPRLERLHLGCDTVGSVPTEVPEVALDLTPGRFVLFVSTIEPRKNHMMIYHVWRRLYQESPDLLVPLVFVGASGWNSADFVRILGMDEFLNPAYLKVLSGLSDSTLNWLYEHCAFTVYPSLYEGWGLPVAESLARGKVCIASNSSSIPEVAQGKAALLDPLDFTAWFSTIKSHLADLPGLASRREALRDAYKPQAWSDGADDFVARVIELFPLKTVVTA